jgi:hypothetical protein
VIDCVRILLDRARCTRDHGIVGGNGDLGLSGLRDENSDEGDQASISGGRETGENTHSVRFRQMVSSDGRSVSCGETTGLEVLVRRVVGVSSRRKVSTERSGTHQARAIGYRRGIVPWARE